MEHEVQDEPAGYRLDATDRLLLRVLDEDPRMSVLLLAQKTGLARGTVQSRLERYRELGLLRLASTRIPPSALGRGLTGTVSVELDQHLLEDAVTALQRIPEVLECFAPAGSTDLLVRVVARDPDDLYRVSEEIRLCPGILRTSTSVFLREVVTYRIHPLLEADAPAADARRRPRMGAGQGSRGQASQPSRQPTAVSRTARPTRPVAGGRPGGRTRPAGPHEQ